MKIDIYNSERYYDPTPYVALNSILNQEEAALRAAAPGGDGFRPVVYVCCPYSGNIEENVCKGTLHQAARRRHGISQRQAAVSRNQLPAPNPPLGGFWW